MFGYCDALTCITFEPGSNLTYVGDSNGDLNLFTRTSPELKVYCEPGLKSKLSGRGVPDERIITTVDVTLVDGDKSEPKKIDYGAKIAALGTPTKPGYTTSSFTGWYTDADCKTRYPDAQLFTNINRTTLYAGWAGTDLTVKNGTISSVIAFDNTQLAIELKNGKAKVPAGATVTVTFDRAAVADNDLKFDHWNISGLNEDEKPKDTSQEEITFTVPADRDAIAIEAVCKSDKTPDANTEYQLSVTGGIVTVKNGDKDVTDTLTVTTDETTGKKTYSVPDGATVTVTLDKTLIPEGMVFDIWSTGKFSLPLGQDYKAETITFTMSSGVDIAAQYRDATIEDDEPDIVGPIVIGTTVVVGGAVLGYQAYSLGAEFAGKLMALPYFPSNRSALAMMLWEDAGKPMPESELLYPDVGQEEQDMDLQHAARWAMENDLVPDLNDEGTAPEEMKFYPDNTVSKIDVLKAWQKAQELKQNA
nr:InlB B-repeat-containing protein [Faecalibacterium sp. BCRC 81149]